MKITVNSTSTATGLSESKEFLVNSQAPIKIPATPNSKVEVLIDGVKQTGNELVNGKRVILKKLDNDLILTLDGEELAEVDGFYNTGGVSLDGGAWQFTSADALVVQDGSLVASPSEITPQVLPLVAASGAGGLLGVLGAVGLAAAVSSSGGTSESPAAALAKIEAYNNGNGTNTPIPTVDDYRIAGVTGVNAGNLAAVNAQVLKQDPGGADSVAEIQPLVGAANAAIAKIEAYNIGDGISPPPLSPEDYAAAGITGVTLSNVAAVNAQVLKQAPGGADTAPEVQALADLAISALNKIEAYNNGDGTIPSALAVVDYEAAGITGVSVDNLAAVNAQVLKQSQGDADTPAEIQNLVNAANAAIAKIEAYNNGTGTTPPPLTLTDYADAGITGVTAQNLAAINVKVFAQPTGGADTAPEVQSLVDTANAAIQKIEAYNNGTGTIPAALTLGDYTDAGITGVTTDNLAAVNAQVLKQAQNGADTPVKVQGLVSDANSAIQKIEAYNNGDGISPVALTLSDYDNAGITGVTADNLAAVNMQVLKQIPGGANSTPEIQALVTGVATAVTTLSNFAQANANGLAGASGTIPDATVFGNAGLTGVIGSNLNAIDDALASALVDGSKTNTAAKLQTLINDYNAILASADGGTAATTPALTTAQFTDIGVSAAATGAGLTLLDNVIDGKLNPAVDTTAEVQALSDAAKAVMTGAAGGTAPTKAQLELLGVTGITAENLVAVQKAIAATVDDGSAVDTLAKLQGIANNGEQAATTALNAISTAAQNNTATASFSTSDTYATAGVTGVIPGNLAAINSALDSGLVDGSKADSVSEVQVIVDAYKAILASADGSLGNTSPALTGNQYAAVGVTGVSGSSAPAEGTALYLLDNVVDLSMPTAVNQVISLQHLADAASHVMSGVAGGTAPSLDDLNALGVTGVTTANLSTAQSAIAHASATGVDTLAELQGVISTALSHPTLRTTLDGVTNLDVTSNLVFSADQTVSIGTGNIHITDLGGTAASGGTGYHGDVNTNTQTIDIATAVANGLVSIVGTGANTKVIINPLWDLDLSSNYQLTIDDGTFLNATGTNSLTGFTPVSFSTVKPGTHGSGTAATEAVASQTMLDSGALTAGKSWLDVENIGNNTTTIKQLGDLSGGAYALVAKNYATTVGGSTTHTDGIALHDTNFGVQNFGNNDVLYFDSQVNNSSLQFFDAGYCGLTDGSSDAVGGLVGQTALTMGLVPVPQQQGSLALIALAFEGNNSNTIYGAVYTLPGTPGFANDWHNQSAPLIMG